MFFLAVDDEEWFRSIVEAQKWQFGIQRTLFFSTSYIKELLLQIYIYFPHL
jgi:hypothetical protein